MQQEAAGLRRARPENDVDQSLLDVQAERGKEGDNTEQMLKVVVGG